MKTKYVVGIDDHVGQIIIKGKRVKSYFIWCGFLERCYSKTPKNLLRNRVYKDCSVCEEWLTYSKFKLWYDVNYPNNPSVSWNLDKDILVRGNKIYGPEYCRFIPQRINKLITNNKERRGKCKIGVSYYEDDAKFSATISIFDETTKRKKCIRIGKYDTEQEAYLTYKKHKEEYIKTVAELYFSKNLICVEIYNSLMNWEIREDD